MLQIFGGQGMEEVGINLQDMLSQVMPGRTRRRRVQGGGGAAAHRPGGGPEAGGHGRGGRARPSSGWRTPGSSSSTSSTRSRAARGGHGPDVSREGVQRDLLPIVEGSTVTTKYGTVRTDHILFIAAGAFHVAKPSGSHPRAPGPVSPSAWSWSP